MKNLLRAGIVAFTFGLLFFGADSVNAQNRRDVREARRDYRRDTRDARQDYRRDIRQGDNRRSARREYRGEIRDARRDYRNDVGRSYRGRWYNNGRWYNGRRHNNNGIWSYFNFR